MGNVQHVSGRRWGVTGSSRPRGICKRIHRLVQQEISCKNPGQRKNWQGGHTGRGRRCKAGQEIGMGAKKTRKIIIMMHGGNVQGGHGIAADTRTYRRNARHTHKGEQSRHILKTEESRRIASYGSQHHGMPYAAGMGGRPLPTQAAGQERSCGGQQLHQPRQRAGEAGLVVHRHFITFKIAPDIRVPVT